MNKEATKTPQQPITGHVYYLEDYTAPKYFNGLYFECLLTDQKIEPKAPLHADLGPLEDWKHEIWKRERFFSLNK